MYTLDTAKYTHVTHCYRPGPFQVKRHPLHNLGHVFHILGIDVQASFRTDKSNHNFRQNKKNSFDTYEQVKATFCGQPQLKNNKYVSLIYRQGLELSIDLHNRTISNQFNVHTCVHIYTYVHNRAGHVWQVGGHLGQTIAVISGHHLAN